MENTGFLDSLFHTGTTYRQYKLEVNPTEITTHKEPYVFNNLFPPHTHLEPQGLGANQMSLVNPDGQHDFVVILHSLSELGF